MPKPQKKMKRSDWIEQYQTEFEKGSAPSVATITRLLDKGQIEGVTQTRIGRCWYVQSDQATDDAGANRIIGKRKHHAA